MVRLTARDIRRLLELLDCELGNVDAEGELYLMGGAVMCLALNARDATRDVDALFKPTKIIRQAAARVAATANAPEEWLNDAVKGYLSPRGDFDPSARGATSKTYRSDEVLAGAPEKRSEPSGSRFDVSGSRPRAAHGPRVIRSRSGQR